MMTESTEAILKRLDQIVKLLAINVTRGLARSEQVSTLQQAGLQVKEVAAALGMKPNAVSVLLYDLRARPKRGEKV